ncbi:SGNH/GDSL hydrolase family protein [Lusitaniella coriacea LEGE 07157]|uniref:SGNH/GDSL hydrolase family protein n=1 Tax=Lusitaniella coriacea LEGE 07157 TaxID=945747 RepID=A0A8J7AXK7_9CYAN|nr:SGNH/GDSL hydrolase family protein [Lusitaniella coriacea]MBE9114539.1 SGNH/GDSL hydrolase family protein [Lusitaniella coriacea LEGE 07157]
MSHIILLGDSIFDNASYVPGETDTVAQLKKKLPDTWKATLLAIDGSRVDDVYAQLKTIPEDATHLILSIGGNNALSHISILDERVASSAEVFSNLADISEQFEQQYQKLLQKILSLNLPTTLCTIYNPRHPEKLYQRIAVAALATFNDVIIRQAFQAGIPLIDLRLTCNEARDYANPIEPSATGGEKIADAILNVVLEHDFRKPNTQVFH